MTGAAEQMAGGCGKPALTPKLGTISGDGADTIVIKAKVFALQERAQKRSPWSRDELNVLLQGVLDTATIGKDVNKASELLAEAEGVFEDSIRMSNRNWYVFALVLGAGMIAGIAAGVLWIARQSPAFSNLADSSTVVSLCAFAGMGSVTSVFTRLSDLDFRKEISRKFVMYSAIAKPIVAVSFASVVYLILKNDMVVLGQLPGSKHPEVLWIAAFLCGFSERFAEDMISRVVPVTAPRPAPPQTRSDAKPLSPASMSAAPMAQSSVVAGAGQPVA
jgi:hypothetical protein